MSFPAEDRISYGFGLAFRLDQCHQLGASLSCEKGGGEVVGRIGIGAVPCAEPVSNPGL